MIRRLDVNGNGTLEPQEMEGRSRFFLERLTRDIPSIDLNQTISLERLISEVQRAQGASSTPASSSTANAAATAAKPLVPTFGDDLPVPLIPGFGDLSNVSSAPLYAVIEADRREAEDRIKQYDRNNDGFLDANELREGRWRDDPMVYDANKDGKLSIEELAQRYAKRRVDEEAQRQARSGGSSSSGASSGPSVTAPSTGGNSRISSMVEDAFNRYDRNKNGVLDREEWREMRTDPSPADKDNNGVITKEEFAAYMESRFAQGGFGGGPGGFGGGFAGGEQGGFGRDRGEGRGGDSSRGSASSSTARSTAPVDTRKSYKLVDRNEKLPKGLPEWFTRNDADGDMQISMAEFAVEWSDAKVAEFNKLDLNGDGVITAKEVLEGSSGSGSSLASASAGGFGRGNRTAAPPARDTRARDTGRPVGPPGPDAVAAATTKPAESGETAPARSTSDELDDEPAAEARPAANNQPIDPAYLSYARSIIAKYDLDESGDLTKNEWVEMATSPESADTNGDQRISVEEFARWKMQEAD